MDYGRANMHIWNSNRSRTMNEMQSFEKFNYCNEFQGDDSKWIDYSVDGDGDDDDERLHDSAYSGESELDDPDDDYVNGHSNQTKPWFPFAKDDTYIIRSHFASRVSPYGSDPRTQDDLTRDD